jgi:endoglycosylceramidase
LDPRDGRPHAFVDAEGREVIFHGSSAVVKGPPWYPEHTEFSTDISMAKEDFEWMQKLGLNFLRLGVMWPGMEPIRGKYNETYLDQIDAVVTLAGQYGVYVMLDMHQDGLSEYFCGEGLPSWAVRRINDEHKWYQPFKKPFPAPFSTFENATCFYKEKRHQGATFPTRQACDSHKHGASFGESTFETAQAYQALWDNWNGTGDAYVAMWAKVAARFKDRTEVVGFNLFNEPFAGDLYHRPLIMVPYPSPTNADRVNLQPTYDKVNTAVRAIDEDVLLFVAGITWGDLGSGFTAAPGGADYANRTVMTYHFYDPPQFSAEEQLKAHAVEAQRLGTAAMLTETEALWSPSSYAHLKGNVTDVCDAQLQGWCDWEWKSFVREGPGDQKSPSQYYEWGAPKTGHGLNWIGVNQPPAYYVEKLARTYAPRVVGSFVKMSFNASHKRSPFELVYDVGSVRSDVSSDIFVWPDRYVGGAVINASASVGKVRVEYDGKSSWVRVFPGYGLQVGARVTVTITSK